MRRALPVAVGLLIVAGGVGGLILFLQSRDEAGIDAEASGPGVTEPELSGPHQPDLVTRDAQPLTRDQLLQALDLGNVVLTYPGQSPPAELRALQRDLTGRFDAELAANGLAVILAEGGALEALAWEHRLAVDDPGDPALRDFVEHWLGRRGR